MNLPDDRTMRRDELLSQLPPEWPEDLAPQIRERVHASPQKVVVLDDDPTGTQTVHHLWVLTQWTREALRSALIGPGPMFYVLHNSRSLPEASAVAINQEIAANLTAITDELGCDLELLSRSDSTLRGHYPAETDALRAMLRPCLGRDYDGVVICPFFAEGGRLTIGDVHWVADGGLLIPAGRTEYARDAVFGYTNSNLRRWVEEKTAGRVPADDVASLSLHTIREQGPTGVRRVLERARNGQPIVVNAASYRDLEVFVVGLLDAEQAGKRFLCRTAASLAQVRGAVPDQDLLSGEQLLGSRRGPGMTIVGSYVERTSRQLEQARTLPGLVAVELSVPAVLDPARRRATVSEVAARATEAMRDGRDALIYTSRERVTERGRAGDLDVGQQVSGALVGALEQIGSAPSYLIAKGGITASDLATAGLGVQRAWVLGQILPGVPVWRLGPESRCPGLPYVVFPGNVGDDESLAAAIRLLRPTS
jgi:uncharacterized protein YgbK (DUF1537 family)